MQQIGLEETILKEIEQNQLTWYGHVQRMAEERLSKIALKWMPKQKRARGRTKENWMEGIKKTMNERNLNEGQWEDMKQLSLGVGQCKKSFEPDIYSYILISHLFNLAFRSLLPIYSLLQQKMFSWLKYGNEKLWSWLLLYVLMSSANDTGKGIYVIQKEYRSSSVVSTRKCSRIGY